MWQPGGALDFNRDGLAAHAMATPLQTDSGFGGRAALFEANEETPGGQGGAAFGDRFMALGHRADHGRKTGSSNGLELES